jgi:hypothetical protein
MPSDFTIPRRSHFCCAAGPKKAIPAAFIWAGACGGLQFGLDKFMDWREFRAGEIMESRWLWQKMTAEQRLEYYSSGAARTVSSGAATMTIDGKLAHQPKGINDPNDPPTSDYLPSLRSFAALKGLQYSPQLTAVPSSPTTAMQTTAAATSAAAAATTKESSTNPPRPWYAWLPIKVGDADAIKLERLQRRLREVEEALGERKATGEP